MTQTASEMTLKRRAERICLSFLTGAVFCSNAGLKAQETPLPRYMTPAEEALMDAYIAYIAPEGIPTPPPGPVRSMAEWEEIEYLTITWAGYPDILAQIVDHAQEECTVIINCNDSNHVINQLAIRGVPNQNLRFIEQNYNSVWIRDYGPNSVYLNDVDSLVLVDWIYNRPRPADDQVPGGIANAFNYALYTSDQAPNDLVHTGGNFMSEGTGIGFSSDLVVRENGASGQFNLTVKTAAEVDSLMKDFMAIDPYIRMDELPHDIISHIDMHMKLLNENTLLVGEFPQGVSDGPQIEANLQYVLTNFSPRHGSWNIIRIPMPPSTSGNYAPNAHYRTYTNSIFINKTVLVPTYRKEYDTTALRIYEEALPGYHIVPINCEDIIPAAGALHCITHSIGLRKPLLIQHWPGEHWSTVHDTIDVHATIRHHSGISSATLYFRFTPDSVFTPLAMNAVGSDRWMGKIMNAGTLIPPDGPGLEYFEYYIEAHSHDGTVARRPLPAPEGYFRARIDYGLSKEELKAELGQVYPNPASAITCVPVMAPSGARGRVELYNAQGQMEALLHDGAYEAGPNRFFFHAAGLTAGWYLVRARVGHEEFTQKVIVQ